MKLSLVVRAAFCIAIGPSAHASSNSTGNPEPRHHLAKRMISHSAADYVGDFLRVTQPEITAWTARHNGELSYYLKYSKEVREKLVEIQTYGTEATLEPYLAMLNAYKKDYLKEISPDDPFVFVSWQDFIDEFLLEALQTPWEYKWKLPMFSLSPEDRVKSLSPELLALYPKAEIEDEDAFDQRPLLMADEISTAEYLAEFSLPFPTTAALTTWLLNNITLPAGLGQETDTSMYIELSRRERIEESLKAIHAQLGAIVERLKSFNLKQDFTGIISIPADSAQPIIDAIQKTIVDWERIHDLVGVMETIMHMLAEEPQ